MSEPNYCILSHKPPNPPRTWSRYSFPFQFNNIFTSSQLDERRKYEILQYKNNQTNLTKNQKLANLYRGKSKIKKTWAYQKNSNIYDTNVLNLPRINNTLIYDTSDNNSGYGCNVTNVNGNICTSTKRSNIPGKEMLICKTDVPLTRYVRKVTFN